MKTFSAHPSHTPKKATSYLISQNLFTLLPTALTVKPEDSSQSPLVRGTEDLARQDINKRVPESWDPHCWSHLKWKIRYLPNYSLSFIKQQNKPVGAAGVRQTYTWAFWSLKVETHTSAPYLLDQDQGAALAWYNAVTCWCWATVL